MPLSISDRDLSGLLPGPVTGLPRLPLSIRASTASCNILFSLRTIISGAPSSSSLFNLLFLFIIRRYKSFMSDVAKRPPSSCTIGLKSGGITGITVKIIHSGLFFDSRKASITSRRFIILALFCPEEFLSSDLSSVDSSSRSMLIKSSIIDSAPIPARNELPNLLLASWYSASVSTCFCWSPVPSCVSSTIYDAKYSTFSRFLGDTSSISPIRLGIPLKYHICDTGAASSICPMRSRLTLDFVTSTPQRSQTTPL